MTEAATEPFQEVLEPQQVPTLTTQQQGEQREMLQDELLVTTAHLEDPQATATRAATFDNLGSTLNLTCGDLSSSYKGSSCCSAELSNVATMTIQELTSGTSEPTSGTSEPTTSEPSGEMLCNGLSLRPASSSECPSNLDIGNCESGGLSGGDLCEGDGECGTNTQLDNCEGYDIYVVEPTTSEPTTSEPTTSEPTTSEPTT